MKKKESVSTHQCAVCGEPAARMILISKVFGRGLSRVLIEDIPSYHCRNCDSQYVDGATMDAIDRIRKNPSANTVAQTIAAAKLAA